MAAVQGKNLDRYILQAFFVQLARVFGVTPYFTLRSDFSDVLQKINEGKAARATEKCFVRPTGFELRQDGYRNNPMAGTGIRANPIAEADGKASKFNVLHPISTDTGYTVTFEVSSYSKMLRLWSLWSNAYNNGSLDFKVNYASLSFDVTVVPSTELTVPEFGEAGGNARTDVTRLEGTLIVRGYTTSEADPHEVPVIHTANAHKDFNLPD